MIANKNYNDHTEPIFKELSILPQTYLITSTNLRFFHSYVFNYIPTAFLNTWPTVGQFHGDNPNFELRNDNKYFFYILNTFIFFFRLSAQ
jgi:hypothetical protein